MKNIFKGIKPFIIKYEPEILMSMGIGGMLFSTIWTVKATLKAVQLIEERKEELNVNKLSKKEAFKTTWRCYLPSALSTVISVPCIIAGNRVSSKRNAALAAAYTISETALQEYQDKTLELVGPEKEQEIREKVAKENNIAKQSNIILPNETNVLWYEPISGRYFKSNWNTILKVCNELNANALSGFGEITLEEWYDALGLDPTLGSNTIGWNTSEGKKGLIDISPGGDLLPDSTPCGRIIYNIEPKKL